MNILQKRNLLTAILVVAIAYSFPIETTAADYGTMAVPVSVDLDTQHGSYEFNVNEVVGWEATAGGGSYSYGSPPDYTIYFTDSRGYSDWFYNQDGSFLIRMDYEKTGDVRGCVTVYGANSSDTDCLTIKIQ